MRTGAEASVAMAGLPSAREVSQLPRSAVAAAILLFVFLTLTPFPDLGDSRLLEVSSGNESATYLAAFALLGLGGLLLHRAGRLPLRLLASSENLLLLAWLIIVSVALSADPGVSARRLVLALATLLLAAMLPWLTRGLRHFTVLMLAIAGLVLALSYLGVLLVPHLTIHQANDLIESDLAGDWRGIYAHKNGAASVMAMFVYVGWFVVRAGRRLTGSVIALAALIFLIESGGKSALGVLVLAVGAAFLVDRARTLPGRAVLAFAPLAAIALLTVGSVVSETARALTAALPIDVTFTGRTDIWSFAIDALRAHPWKGQGFEAFWYSDQVRFGAEDSSKWMADVATSHNSYLDLALTVGLPGLGLVALAFLVAPLRNFHATLATPENRELARLFLVLWLFSLYLGCFEAFFLSRSDPMWFVLALAACGLRCTAELEVRE
ncbi:MAG TPA: O-antigen ligase [Xanthobacteraceae bacterium]|nr:O-antigen ligase [Xanthobacteraceae bacterium]